MRTIDRFIMALESKSGWCGNLLVVLFITYLTACASNPTWHEYQTLGRLKRVTILHRGDHAEDECRHDGPKDDGNWLAWNEQTKACAKTDIGEVVLSSCDADCMTLLHELCHIEGRDMKECGGIR